MTRVLYIPTATTGETPAAWLSPEFGGREDYSLKDWQYSACMDAPDLIAAGSHINRNYDRVPASRYTSR